MPLRPDMEMSEYLEILRRRKWYIVFSILLILFGASVYCVVTPEKYSSSTTILVIPQRVPEGYIRSTVSTGVDERLFTIQQQVMSRTRLVSVMEELGLFKEERRRKPIEEVVEGMREADRHQVPPVIPLASWRHLPPQERTMFRPTSRSTLSPRRCMSVTDQPARSTSTIVTGASSVSSSRPETCSAGSRWG